MNPRAAIRLGLALQAPLGRHVQMIGDDTRTQDEYLQAQAASDRAGHLLRYLAQHLQDRHAAVLMCRAAGCPGYINFR